MNALYQQKLVVNGQLTESAGVQLKVEQDIAFLRHRIELMKKQKIPNNIVITTYENMLKSRMSVLAWLQDGNSEESMP
jgi:hypothetical protein